ncbi:hypothetical protein [Parasphingopyxis marina]|uniref:Uncharacterized protein n=1 Tax=Parasphingopyxis marina TaxID=2761622 RepID=A0A842I220_9SPHN|nr:hypothetical protein [Parasphingopyxis marina]MBC2777824.1 hypothetical protein [Parasphingopyxis marina]
MHVTPRWADNGEKHFIAPDGESPMRFHIFALIALLATPLVPVSGQDDAPPPLHPFVPSAPVVTTDNIAIPGHLPAALPRNRARTGLAGSSSPGGLPPDVDVQRGPSPTAPIPIPYPTLSRTGASSNAHIYQSQQSDLVFARQRAGLSVGSDRSINIGANRTRTPGADQPVVIGRLANGTDHPPRPR